MDDNWIGELLGRIAAVKEYIPPDSPLPVQQRCLVLPRLTWQPDLLNRSLGITVPPDLRMLWDRTSGVIMYEDVTYGQWGLVLWSPDQTVVRHRWWMGIRNPVDFREGDLIAGEFLGDCDLLVVRSDPSQQDYGSVLISLAEDRRQHWPRPAASVERFLRDFLQADGRKFWLHNR